MSGIGRALLYNVVFPLIEALGWLIGIGLAPLSSRQWYRQRRGGHWEHRYHGDVGQYSIWTSEPRCRRDERDGWQRGTATCEEWPRGHQFWSLFGWGRTRAYASYVLRHKFYVARAGLKVADTLFEKWLCLLHDNNKFHPAMWGPYADHFYLADGSSRNTVAADGFYKDVDDDLAFDRAWLWHIQRSKHHPQYWCSVVALPCGHWPGNALLEDDGGVKCLKYGCGGQWRYEIYGQESWDGDPLDAPQVSVVVHEMPTCYITEMLCDWIGAGLAQGKPDTLGWYRARGYRHPMGKRTRALVEQRLGYEREAVP